MVRTAARSASPDLHEALAQISAFADRLGNAPLTCIAATCSHGEAMLVIEPASVPGAGAGNATWVVTARRGGMLSLEEVVDDCRLDLLAIGPADRIVARLVALASRSAVHA